MMNLIFFTPPVTFDWLVSTYLPHLVEHCVGRTASMSPQNYFADIFWRDVFFNATYTAFRFPDDISVREMVNKVGAPLDSYVIQKEIEMLAQEYTLAWEHPLSLERLTQLELYGSAFRDDDALPVTVEEVQDYHHQRYQGQSFVWYGKDEQVHFSEWFRPLNRSAPWSLARRKLICGGEELTVFTSENTNRQDYYHIFFLKELLDAFYRYEYRYNLVSMYDYPETTFFHSRKQWVLILPCFEIPKIPEAFFVSFRKYFLANLFSEYSLDGFAYFHFFYPNGIGKNDVLDFIHTFDWLENTENPLLLCR